MKCYFCENDAQGQCYNDGRFVCRNHSEMAEIEWKNRLICSECADENKKRIVAQSNEQKRRFIETQEIVANFSKGRCIVCGKEGYIGHISIPVEFEATWPPLKKTVCGCGFVCSAHTSVDSYLSKLTVEEQGSYGLCGTRNNAYFADYKCKFCGKLLGSGISVGDGDYYYREFQPKQKSGCFITTACVNTYGLSDDCQELTILRWFRDTYIRSLSNSNSLVDEYYTIAPLIIQKIQEDPNHEKVWGNIFTIIQKSVKLILKSDYDRAFNEYIKMVNDLKRNYLT